MKMFSIISRKLLQGKCLRVMMLCGLFLLGSYGRVVAKIDAVKDTTAAEIIFEATLPENNSYGKPLPLTATWNDGLLPGGFSPEYQLGLIEQGHYILPSFQMPGHTRATGEYYEKAMKKAAEMKLPLTLISTQWESLLTTEDEYYSLPPDKNPNVVNNDNIVMKKVSPFGPVKYWREVGGKRASDPLFPKIAKWYQEPPLVLFLSNNEHAKLRWHEAEISKRYMSLYGSGKTDEFKRKLFGDQWIERYGALFKGIEEHLPPSWAEANHLFCGYNAFGPGAFGRWYGWINYSLYSTGRFEPWPAVWDGASVSYYVNDWDPSVDYTVWSPQVRAMNWVFMLDEARRMNPDFWFELSVWDGHQPGKDTDMWHVYANRNQTYTPERYAGMALFGMWLLRPRVVREYRGWSEKVVDVGDYFLALTEAVDRVHKDLILRKFWRKGELVPNTGHKHPYQSNIPEEYKNKNRWFLLDTSVDPSWPWSLDTEVPVFSLALYLGTAPKREWLIYAFSPLKERKKIKVSIPGYKQVQINAAPAGTYWYVREEGDKVDALPLRELPKLEPPKNLLFRP